MRYLVLPAPQRPPPWGDRPAEWPVLLRPAFHWTREALAAAGCAEGDGSLAVGDDLFATPEFVADFLAIAGTRGVERDRVAVLGAGLLAERDRERSLLPPGPDGSLPLPLLLFHGEPPADHGELLARCAEAEPVVVDAKEQRTDVPVPRPYADEGKRTTALAASRRFAIHLTHRTHLLEANVSALGAQFVRTLEGNKLVLALRWLVGRLLWPRRLFSRFGRNCKVHPTAIVEGCQVGDGVEIGAYAVVRASVIGDGAAIEDGAHVQFTAVGPGARVARLTSVFSSVMMEGSHSAQPIMQGSVLGKESATTTPSWFLDVNFVGPIRVEGPEGYVGAGTKLLGCTVGHRTTVGGGVFTGAGRMLPGNAVVIGPQRDVIKRTDGVDPIDAGGAVLTVEDGRLVEVKR